jgi:formylglycine-generating enzyme required for sulfatase activity
MTSPADLTKTAAIDAFVEEIRREPDPWRKARLLAFLRKERWHNDLLEEARKAYDAEKDREPGDRQCYWAALELITEPSREPPAEGPLWIEPVSGVCFVRIAPGTFDMGSEEGHESERPIHKVTIKREYWLARHPITNGEYRRYLDANPLTSGTVYFKYTRRFVAGQPVVRVNWREAQEGYCGWLRAKTSHPIHLPTEAEWEYACRAGSSAKWCYGHDDEQLENFAWWGGGLRGSSHPVGLKRSNLWGLQDMHGNVWEWCWDEYGPYSRGNQSDPAGPLGGGPCDHRLQRVQRGGSYRGGGLDARCSSRDSNLPSGRSYDVGFRPVFSSVPRPAPKWLEFERQMNREIESRRQQQRVAQARADPG